MMEELTWYNKVYKYLINRNQIIPEKIELPESDFLIVSRRRTIRVIKPEQKSDQYYKVVEDNSSSINENFISKWIKRPHSINSCRCSFRHSSKLNKNNREIDNNKIIEITTTIKNKQMNGFCFVKTNQSVKNLENYIDEMLKEIFDDTINSIFKQIQNESRMKKDFNLSETLLDVKFTFPSVDDVDNADFNIISESKSYINQGFLGSPCNPDCLNFNNKTLFLSEKLDSDDSGINSVETIDFQPTKLDLDFEQSLMKIIDAKFSQVSFTNDKTVELDNKELVLESTDSITNSLKCAKVNSASELSNQFDVDVILADGTPSEFPSIKGSFRRVRKPMIMFLHGFGSSAEVFRHQIVYFSKIGYPCIAPDLLGHGLSSAPDRSRDYVFDKLLNDVETVLKHYIFESEQKCVLVAHNYGCSFATALAQKYEDKIHQLVLISGGGPTPLVPPNTEGPGYYCLRFGLSPFLMCGLRRNILYSARGRQHPYCGSESKNQWPSHMKYVLNGMNWPTGDHIFHKKINNPTLLIHGLRDNKVSLVQECQMERTLVKAFLEAIPTAGHIPMVDNPQQVNHMIHCFIDLWEKNL